MIKTKKGVLDLVSMWVEYVALVVLFIGFFISMSSGSAFLSYIIIFLSGLLTGRILFQQRKALPFKYYILMFVFLIGYILGTYVSFGSRKVIVIVFILSNILSYYIHDKFIMKNILIKDKKAFEQKLKRIKSDGKDSLHVICDFDKTLTKAFVKDQKTHTSISQIREGGYLSEEYVKKSFALYDKYHPFEINHKISDEEKDKKMMEWWSSHIRLLE